MVFEGVCPCSIVLAALNRELSVEATLLRYPKHLNRRIPFCGVLRSSCLCSVFVFVWCIGRVAFLCCTGNRTQHSANRMTWYPGKEAGNSSFCLQAPERCGLGYILTNTMSWLCQHFGPTAQPNMVFEGECPCSIVLAALNRELSVEATYWGTPSILKQMHPVM